MDTMSVKQAAMRLNVAEKTIFRYLLSGKLTSEKIGSQHYIPTEQVENMAKSRHVPTDEKTRLDNRVNTLYEITDALAFRVKALEEKLRAMQALPTVQTAQETRRETQETPVLPDGTLTISEFADALGIARKTLLDAVMKYDLDHIAIPNPARPKEMKRYFTPEQQTAIKQWRASRQT